VLLVLSGGVLLLDTFGFWWKKWSGFFLHLIVSLLYLGVGFSLLMYPVEASVSLTLFLGIFYILAGVLRIGFAATLKTPRWGWAWFNGIVTLILGVLILSNWPASGLFIIGLFVGIDLLFAGWTFLMFAWAGHRLSN
jgi:uncharacterized membrane protein HdeD (DUF308 family)